MQRALINKNEGRNHSGSTFQACPNDHVYPYTHSFEEVIEAIKKNNGCVVDDHSSADREEKVWGVGFFRTRLGREHVVWINARTRYFSINPIYIDEDDGKPHLGRASVGGVLVPDREEMVHGVALKDMVDYEVAGGTMIKTHIF